MDVDILKPSWNDKYFYVKTWKKLLNIFNRKILTRISNL